MEVPVTLTRQKLGLEVSASMAKVDLAMKIGTKDCRHGRLSYLLHDAYIGRSLDVYGEYSEGELELFRQLLRPGDVAVDVGANIGALTVGLSPIFLPMAASYMTDVAGLFVIVLCLYLCQRAAAARSDRAAVLWLCCAAISNVVGGTVRQICWLGALVMVPSTVIRP